MRPRKPLGTRIVFWIFCALLILVLAASFFPSGEAPASPQTARVSYLKQIALACLMYANDYDDRLPDLSSMGGLSEALEARTRNGGPYLKELRFLVDPDTWGTFPLNPRLSGAKLDHLKKPGEMVLAYATTATNGKRAVAFADGYAKTVPEAQFERQLKASTLR